MDDFEAHILNQMFEGAFGNQSGFGHRDPFMHQQRGHPQDIFEQIEREFFGGFPGGFGSMRGD